MKPTRIHIVVSACAVLTLTASGSARASIILPDLLYYKFNEGSGSTTANSASPGVGTNPAVVTGHTLDAPGVFGSTALNGIGGTGLVSTGWATALGTGNWTVAFWHSPVTNAGNTQPSYAFGDLTAGGFRAFNSGSAGADGMLLAGTGLTDVLITGLSSTQNNHIAFVYDAAAGDIKGYLNGVLTATVAQVPPLDITGTEFLVGAFTASSGLRDDRWIDEFQLYSRALSGADVIDAMNANFTSASASGAAVPEPASLALFGVLSLGAVSYVRRKGALLSV